jgi:hypothetical protein
MYLEGSMQRVLQRSAVRAVQLLIFEALKVDAPRLNDLAATALLAIGPDVVSTLMAEIANSKNVRYKLRLLVIVERIGEVLDPADHLQLFELSQDRDSRIREAAVDAILATKGRPQVIPVVALPAAVEQPTPSSLGADSSPVHADTASSGGVDPTEPSAHTGDSPAQAAKDVQRATGAA